MVLTPLHVCAMCKDTCRCRGAIKSSSRSGSGGGSVIFAAPMAAEVVGGRAGMVAHHAAGSDQYCMETKWSVILPTSTTIWLKLMGDSHRAITTA